MKLYKKTEQEQAEMICILKHLLLELAKKQNRYTKLNLAIRVDINTNRYKFL